MLHCAKAKTLDACRGTRNTRSPSMGERPVMNIATLPTTDDEHVADQLVNRAAATLDREGGGVRAAFLQHLFALRHAEDLVDYQPAELAALRPAPTNSCYRVCRANPHIRVYDPDTPRDGERVKSISVHRDRQRRHAVPGRFGDGGDHRTSSRGPAGRASDFRGHARCVRQDRSPRSGRSRQGDAARKLHAYPCRSGQRP